MASRALKQSSVKRVQYLMREERLNTADRAMKRDVHIPVHVYIARKGRPGLCVCLRERERERERESVYV